MDVSHTEHSHVIGKGGNNIKRVMTETGCHIHFPDSNRGNSLQEKSNQVSIAGQPDGVETARSQIRELLPLVFMFEIPVSSPVTTIPDVSSPLIQQLQQTNNVTINFKQRPRTFTTTAIIRGSVHSAKGVKQVTARLMEQLTGNVSLPVSMQLEIAPQHHMFIIGRAGVNIKHIMQQTGANILFPDPNTAAPQRKGTVFISGSIDSVFMARQQLIGCLPLVLMFDIKETIELDQGRITHLMESLDVYISVKPKPKQPSKSVIVKSIERNAANMYWTREILLGLRSDIQQINAINCPPSPLRLTPLSFTGLGYLSPSSLSVNNTNYLHSGHPNTNTFLSSGQPSTTSFIPGSQSSITSFLPSGQQSSSTSFLLNGQHTSSTIDVSHCATSPVISPNQWGNKTQVYSPLMVITPAANISSIDILSPPGSVRNGFHPEFAGSAFIHVPTPLDHGPSCNTSDSASPPQSPSNSPTTAGLCKTAADLVNLQKRGTLGEVLTHDTLLATTLHPHHQQQHLLQQHHQQHGLTSPTSQLYNGRSHTCSHLMNGDSSSENGRGESHPSDKLAPGIERKSSTTSLYSSNLQYGFDYEQKKLLAMKAMQKKPEGESRTPTDIWAGMGFSKSMPESAIRDKLGQMGISARVTDTSITSGYEPNRPEIDLNIDKDLWTDGTGSSNRPLNKAPGEYPSPRKKFQYGLSHSNHVDSASLPSSKAMWSTKTDLAELFSALSLGKYTDLFQQQEIDLSTFLTLSDHDLRELGISTFGARRKMLLAIADLNKRRTLLPSSSLRTSSSIGQGLPADTNTSDSLRAGGNSVSQLFPSPSPAPSLINSRGGPDLGSLSGHW
uniref:SAM domain-containing protein n=1 Tax=Biomphalaria glabrata TaxID=6526 RepID=A0A2C9KDG4_BIOGL